MEKGSEISRAVIKSHNVMVLISEAVAPVAALIDVAQLVLPPRSGGAQRPWSGAPGSSPAWLR